MKEKLSGEEKKQLRKERRELRRAQRESGEKVGLLAEFAAFIKKGNVFQLAIGIIIGGAFQKIVDSLVRDIIMPLVSAIIRVNISDASVELVPATASNDAVIFAYGTFIQAIINFLIIALSIFVGIKVMVNLSKAMNRTKDELAKKLKARLAKEEEDKKQKAIESGEIVEENEVEAELEVEEEIKEEVIETKSDETKLEELLTEIRDILKKD